MEWLLSSLTDLPEERATNWMELCLSGQQSAQMNWRPFEADRVLDIQLSRPRKVPPEGEREEWWVDIFS